MNAPVALRLRPLEIGDILDETFRMYRRHFLLLAGVSVVFQIPVAGVAGFGYASFFGELVNQEASGNPFDMAAFTGTLGALGVGLVVNLLVLPLLYGSVSYAICESALGHPITLAGALRAGFRRYLRLAGYYALVFLMVGVGFCLIPLWIWILVGWSVVVPVMFIENIGLGAAMGRSWRLVQGRWWRTFFVLFLVYILTVVVSAALGAFLYLGQILLSILLSPTITLAVYEAAAILAEAVVIPIFQIAIVLIYFDLRVRKEALDLFQHAQRIAALPLAPA